MKSFFPAFAVAATLAATLAASPALAGAGHDHGPKHGGVVREVKDISLELVARPDSLTLHVGEHGKPLSTQGATAEATLYAGGDKIPVKFEPAGENRMAAKGSFKVGVGVRVTVTATVAGKPPVKATFNLK